MPSGPGINSQKGMEAILSCAKPYSTKDTRRGVDKVRVWGTEDVFHDLLILAAF